MERSEEKVELSERYLRAFTNGMHFVELFPWWIFSNPPLYLCSKIVELEEELRVVGNNLKSLEVSEEKVKHVVPKGGSSSFRRAIIIIEFILIPYQLFVYLKLKFDAHPP